MSKKYRIDTDKGSYIIETDEPDVSQSLMESRQAASKSEFDANQPQSTIGTRTREAAIGALEPFALGNAAGSVGSAGSAVMDALTGKGTSKMQDMVKALVSAPAEPVKNWVSGLAEGDYDKAAYGSGGMLMQTAPAIAGAVESAPTRATAELAERLYESALKPGPRSNTLDEIRRMVRTGLDERIPVTEGGADRLDHIVEALNRRVQESINNNPNVTVNKFRVASRLQGPAERAATTVNPEADMRLVSRSGNEFLRNQPNDITAQMAQALKQGTYRKLKDAAYGEIKGASIESQKALARGLREELANQIPDLNPLNAREGNLLGLRDELEAAVNRHRNKEMFGIGTPILSGAVGAATGSGPLGAAAGLAKALIERPGVKSRLAIALARLSR